MFSKMRTFLKWSAQLALAFAVQCGSSSVLAKAQGRVDVIRFPDEWTRIDSNARKVSEEERLLAQPVLNGYRYLRADDQGIDAFDEKKRPSSVRYEAKLFAKSGRAWGDVVGMVSPTGKWLAVLSYTSPEKRTKSHGILDEGGEPERGIVHIDIYDAGTGVKALATQQSYNAAPSSIFYESVWVNDQYFVMPLDFNLQKCVLITLPAE